MTSYDEFNERTAPLSERLRKKAAGFASIAGVKWWFPAVVAIVLTAILELAFFNHNYFFNQPEGQIQSINLPMHEGLKKPAVVLTDKQTNAQVNVGQKISTIEIETFGPRMVLNGVVMLTDEVRKDSFTPAATFSVNPTGKTAKALVSVRPHGKLLKLALVLENAPATGVAVTGLRLNVPYELAISPIRVFVCFLVIFLLLALLMHNAASVELDWRKRTHKLYVAGITALCLLPVMGFLSMLAPWNYPANQCFWYIGGSNNILGNSQQSLLIDVPKTEELNNYDAYVQLFDAFSKRQLNLDLPVDPKLQAMPDPYDASARAAQHVKFNWDRAFYNGKYYCYFGPAPMFTVYFPVWALTGKLPSPVFALDLLSVLAVFSTVAALLAVIRFFNVKPSLLMFGLSTTALVSGMGLYLFQTSVTFYYQPYLSAIFWLGVFITCAYQCLGMTKALWRNVLAVIAGIAVVMIVLSRPLYVLYAVVFGIPVLYRLFTHSTLSTGSKYSTLAAVALPVALGAVFTMWYNYARFGSVLEFGQYLQLTVMNIRVNTFSFSLTDVMQTLYCFWLEPLNYKESFPFIGLSNTPIKDTGNFMYAVERLGLLQIPMFFGLGLMFFKNSVKGLRPLTAALFFVALILSYFALGNAGIHIRYTLEAAFPIGIAVVLLIMTKLRDCREEPSKKLFVTVAAFLMVETILFGLLIPFAGENHMISTLNPDGFITFARSFSPF